MPDITTTAQVRFYYNTYFNPQDLPMNASLLNQYQYIEPPNSSIKSYDYIQFTSVLAELSDEDIQKIDYVRVIHGDKTYYYFVMAYSRVNFAVMSVALILDAITTIGVNNIVFNGVITRRSLGKNETYIPLPEPWKPKRQLKGRHFLLDYSEGASTLMLPSLVSLSFTANGETVNINLTSTSKDIQSGGPYNGTEGQSSSYNAAIALGTAQPTPANAATLNVNTPWGNYIIKEDFQQYYNITGTTLTQFLADLKKTDALNYIDQPYYVPDLFYYEASAYKTTFDIPEITTTSVANPKASRYYTTVSVRSLATQQILTYGDEQVLLKPTGNEITVVCEPQKGGGLFLLPTGLRNENYTKYSHKYGVYTPFRDARLNAVGTTSEAYIGSQQLALSTGFNNMFKVYAGKMKSLVFKSLYGEYIQSLIGSIAAGGSFLNNAFSVGTIISAMTAIENIIDALGTSTSLNLGAGIPGNIKASYNTKAQMEQLNYDYDMASRDAQLRNEAFQVKVSDTFNKITPVGNPTQENNLRCKYELIVQSLDPHDIQAFDRFLTKYGTAVDDYSNTIIFNTHQNYQYVMVDEEESVLTIPGYTRFEETVMKMLKGGVRFWKNKINTDYANPYNI